MTWQDAVEVAGDGCTVLIEVTASSKSTVFPAGHNEWRGRIGMKVHAPAQDGRANREVLTAVAKFFHVPPARVRIEAGESDSRKRIAVDISRDAAIERLAEVLE